MTQAFMSTIAWGGSPLVFLGRFFISNANDWRFFVIKKILAKARRVEKVKFSPKKSVKIQQSVRKKCFLQSFSL